jgi:hypothetical protein
MYQQIQTDAWKAFYDAALANGFTQQQQATQVATTSVEEEGYED